jgi:hypothetical protein
MLGYVSGHSCFTNDTKALKRLGNRLQLAASLAEMRRFDKDQADKKRDEEQQEIRDRYPAAKQKLAEKNGDVSKITKKEILAILLVDHGLFLREGKHSKQDLVEKLVAKMGSSDETGSTATAAAENHDCDEGQEQEHGHGDEHLFEED